MRIHLVDGTYELFRHYYNPGATRPDPTQTAATRGVVGTVIQMLGDGCTHIGVATDHVIESFRNRMWRTYKSSAGMAPDLLAQFTLLEDALTALGVTVWAMTELEADDALATAAAAGDEDDRVEQVAIWTPDKDLGQCVRTNRVVQVDRRSKKVIDEQGVIDKFGVPPASIPDYLALVGDSADGFPGIPGFGAKSAAAVLARYGHLEDIPERAADWDGVAARNPGTLAAALAAQRDDAFLFRDLATLRRDPDLVPDITAIGWAGPTKDFPAICERIDADRLLIRARQLAKQQLG